MRQTFNRLVLMFLMIPSLAQGDINKEMNKFFENFGSSVNVSSGSIYQGQKAGYFTAGGLTIRNRVMQTQLMNINLPKIEMGCGGIDIYSGGFSFIDGDQLIDTMKSIGSASKTYAFMLGVETVSPQVANVIKQLQTWANEVNEMSINSCELGAQITGMVWPKNTQASQHICRSMGSGDGIFSDYVASRHSCGQGGAFDREMGRLASDPRYQDQLIDEYNIAWEAVKKHRFLSEDEEIADLFMTLMGTVVVRKEEEGRKVESYPSKIANESFLKALLEGAEVKVYHCSRNDKKGLSVKEKTVSIDSKSSWNGKVQGMLLEMQNKILEDQELNESERELLTKSSLPLYKIVNVLTAYKGGYCPIDLYEVSGPVAMDLLIQYLREVIEIVREGVSHLRRGQFYAEDIDRYLDELVRVERSVRYYEVRSAQQMERSFHMMQKIQLIEEQLASEIDLGWGGE